MAPAGYVLAVLATLTGLGRLIAAGLRWHRERQNRSYRVAQQQGEVANVDRQATRVATELQRAVADNAKHATADLAAIRARLAA